MRRILVLLVIIGGVLGGCGDKELSSSEVQLEDVSEDIQESVAGIVPGEDPEDNGIYLFTTDGKNRYMYLNEDFLDSGKGFGDFEVKGDGDTFSAYVNESDKPTENRYKLYKIKLDREYEYMRLYKNGEETHMHRVIVGGS